MKHMSEEGMQREHIEICNQPKHVLMELEKLGLQFKGVCRPTFNGNVKTQQIPKIRT